MDQTKPIFPSINIVDESGAPTAVADQISEGAVPLKSGGNGTQPGDGSNHGKVVIVGSGPGRTHCRDLRRARQPGADRHRRLHARRPADDHQRRRELPRFPGRHPGTGADAEVPRAGRAVRRSPHRLRRRQGRLLVPALPSVVGGHRIQRRVGHRVHRCIRALARPRQRDAAARPRRKRLRDV